MIRTTLGLCSALIVCSGFGYACSAIADASAFDPERSPSEGGHSADAGAFQAPDLGSESTTKGILDNGVIIVHAAKVQSFRLCFKGQDSLRPMPDSQVMPEANVVGVEVGSAVRIPPLAGPPGEVILFDEPLIRPYYPVVGSGASCAQLLASQTLGKGGVSLGTVDTDLSSGVHLLVVRGCPSNSVVRNHDVGECGATWTPDKGNLSVKEITVTGADRGSANTLPAHVINLSQPLEGERNGRDVVVSFGPLTATNDLHTGVATNPVLFAGQTTEPAKQLPYDPANEASYDSLGFRVRLVVKGGGASTTRLDESLANIQKSSASRDVPGTYYAAASNYALLLLGDPDAKLSDGGPDNDRRRNLHFLAVPVVAPKADGGGIDPPPPQDPEDAGAPALP